MLSAAPKADCAPARQTMAKNFGVEARGAFYDRTGAIRDMIQNHVFQIISNLAMELPVRIDSETIRAGGGKH
ncbi:MAG: hypothetical protein WBE76_03215 [Terracidiphilus sp.]